MVDHEKLAGIILGGFVAGLLASAITLSPVTLSRAEQIATFFEDICISNHYGQLEATPEAWGFVAAQNPDGSELWVHPQTVTYLRITPFACRLDTHAPHALSEGEAKELLARIEPIVAQQFPNLPHDPNARLGTVFKGWAEGPIAHPNRWGIFLFAYPDWQDSAGSSLYIIAPKGLPL